MAVTPQTNTTLEDIAEALSQADNIVIGGHVGPDGDCIGSQMALMHALRSLGKTVSATLAKPEPIDQALTYLPGTDELVFAGDFEGPVEVFVAVDVPTKERLLPDQWALHERANLTVTVDHHAVESCMAQMSYTDPDAASCSLLVWKIAQLLGTERVPGVALSAYTGLMTDTNSFCNSNTDAWAFAGASEMLAAGADPSYAAKMVLQQRRIQSIQLEGLITSRMAFLREGQFVLSYLKQSDFEELDAVKSDADPLIDVLRSIKGVRVACILREQEKDVRGSFRAKDDTDVSAWARHFGGGGHRAAAGFSMDKPLDKALDVLSAYVLKELN